MLESERRVSTGIKEHSEAETTLAKVRGFASDERFAAVSPALRDAAIAQAIFFIDASDQVVDQQLKNLYEEGRNSNGGFNHHEKETFGSLHDLTEKYTRLYDGLTESDGLSPAEARAEFRKEKKADVASRYARLDFAKTLHYLPGLEGSRGERDYGATVSNPEFKLAESLVREAVGKFG